MRPSVCYILDLAWSGVAATGLYKLATNTPFIVDTGDAIVELGHLLGRGPIGTTLTRALEAYALRAASIVVVRGSYHKELLARKGVKAEFIPDGVTVDQFVRQSPPPEELHRPLVIGLVGSSVWVEARKMCYGWELVEVIRLLKEQLSRPVRGVLIGDGTGLEVLKRRVAEYQLGDAIEFAGRVPYSELPDRLRSLDICLSTQTDDVIGNVRTTGKLPLYLAAGRFVLASRVGEAARILPPEMLVEFSGQVDPAYPMKLAARIKELVNNDMNFHCRHDLVNLARQHFDYSQLAPRVESVLDSVLEAKR
jgi:glycosyltransferase involved in cell wall biosynthesis